MSYVEVSRGDLVEVLWDDAEWWHGTIAESHLDHDDDLCAVITWGIVVKTTPRSIYVAHERLSDADLRGVSRIPRAYVRGIRVLDHLDLDAQEDHQDPEAAPV